MTGLQIEFRLYLKTNGKAVKCFREEGDTSCVLFFFFFIIPAAVSEHIDGGRSRCG